MASTVGHLREAERLTLQSSAVGDSTDVEKDIDGVPLRDHKKIDLKLILGHAPDVEDEEDDSTTSGDRSERSTEAVSLPGLADDDDEYEYGYDDGNEAVDDNEEDGEGEGRVPVRQLQRRSSLKAIHLPEDLNAEGLPLDSPGLKKAVRFADALGLGLAAVRDLFNSDEPPEIPNSALKDLRIRKKRSKLGEQLHLALDFVQPSSDSEFMNRLLQQKVILENCVASDRDLTVSGVIRVINISFEKRVTVRYTTDHWTTFKDASTMYVPNSNDGATDRFMFIVHLPAIFGRGSGTSTTSRLELAIEYNAGNDVYWDSNEGSNYGVDCIVVPASPRKRAQAEFESSGSEGEFII